MSPPDQRLQHGEVDRQPDETDGEEASRLETRVILARGEGPVAVPEEVAADGDRKGPGCGDRVVDAEVAGDQRDTPRLIRYPDPPTRLNLAS
jgi:hypothetical protein